MIDLTVQHEGRLVPIPGQRGMRVLVTVLALLGQIEHTAEGKLTISWGGDTTGLKLKWALEAFGRDVELMPPITTS